MPVARGQMLMAALLQSAVQNLLIQCSPIEDNEGFEAEVRQNKAMGFDGKILINRSRFGLHHLGIFAPTEKEVAQAGDGQRVPRLLRPPVSACSGQRKDG